MKPVNSKSYRFFDWVIIILFVLILIIVFSSIVFRYVLNHSLAWSDEAVRYLFVQFTMLGIALALRDRQHIRVEFFVSLLPVRIKRVVEFLALALVVAFNVVIFYTGMQWFIASAGATTPALGLPRNWVFFSALPISALLVVIFGMRRILRGQFAELEPVGEEVESEREGE